MCTYIFQFYAEYVLPGFVQNPEAGVWPTDLALIGILGLE
jgi:hypothetical protein